jgi:putative ABC transport system ATP-binding protein
VSSEQQPFIQVKELTKVYHMGGVDVHALRGVSMSARAGEFLAILGPSGSGKSTLFHIIGGLTPPSGGEVFIDGKNLSRMTDADRTALRRTTVGFVFQRFNLLPTLTAGENIEIARHIAGNHNSKDENFESMVRILGIAHRLHHKPFALSGGEQQRVAIARAIVNKPAILLADEPTGNLDTENSLAVLDTLKHLNRETGQTILMITHNPEAAAYCAHRVLSMRDGQITEG